MLCGSGGNSSKLVAELIKSIGCPNNFKRAYMSSSQAVVVELDPEYKKVRSYLCTYATSS